MYAIIQTSGQQFKVTKGDEIWVDYLNKAVGETIEFSDVRLVVDDSKNAIKPSDKAKVIAKIVKDKVKGEKIVSFKFRRRKNSKTKKGHRQLYSVVKIENIQQ